MLLDLSSDNAHTIELYPDTLGLAICDISISTDALQASALSAQAVFDKVRLTLPNLWDFLSTEVSENRWILANAQEKKPLNFSVLLVSNAEIHQLNREFREKDKPTDVLTFSLFEEALMDVDPSQVPEISLGEIYLSIDWAVDEVCKGFDTEQTTSINFLDAVSLFLIERLIHGCLHLLGVHHDTISEYNYVIHVQQAVIRALNEKVDQRATQS